MGSAAALPEVRWLWNGALDLAGLGAQLRAMAAAGIGAVAVWPWAGLEHAPTTRPYLECLQRMCALAAELGIGVWLADDMCWPSGSVAGQLITARPELAQRVLLVQSRWVRQPSGAEGAKAEPVVWRGEGEQLLLATALGIGGARRDLARMLEANGHPTRERRTSRFGGHRAAWVADLWDATITLPPGDWFIVTAAVARTYALTPSVLGANWASGMPGVLDTLNPQSVAAFVDAAYRPVEEALGPWLGSVIAGLLTVPPPLPALHDLPEAAGWRTDALPWTPGLERDWTPGGALGFQREVPYLVAKLHDPDADQDDTLAPVRRLAQERETIAYRRAVREWCASRSLGLLTLDPDALQTLPAIPYTLRGDRKRAIAPDALATVSVAALPCAYPHLIWPETATDGSGAGTERQAGEPFGPVWRWQPLSLNVHALDGWTRTPGAFGERLRLQASFVVEHLPDDLCLAIEAGTVESVSLNGAGVDLARARLPRTDEIELADVLLRVMPLRSHPALRYGVNVLDITIHIPVVERLSFPGTDNPGILGPVFLAGSFALGSLSNTTGAGLVVPALTRPPVDVPLGAWHTLGYPRFTGTAVYEQAFVSAGGTASGHGSHARLAVHAPGCAASVLVNGNVAAPLPDGSFDLSPSLRAGINQLAVRVTAGLAARLFGKLGPGLASVRLKRGA